jgi:hypothetical protein
MGSPPRRPQPLLLEVAVPTDPEPRLLVAEEGVYKFGVGPLRLRVTGLLPDLDTADGRWRRVLGFEVAWNGMELGERTASVRADVLAVFLAGCVVRPALIR